MLNLKIGQKIKSKFGSDEYTVYSISSDKKMYWLEDSSGNVLSSSEKILRTYYLLPKEPWVPEYDEVYWTITCLGGKMVGNKTRWHNTPADNDRLAQHLVFRTKDEANEVLAKMLKVAEEESA